MGKLRYLIRVLGCDDETEVFRELTEDEVKFLTELSKQINEASESHCQPRMYLVPPDQICEHDVEKDDHCEECRS